MGIEDDISDMRSKLRELTDLVLLLMTDEQIASSHLSNEQLQSAIEARSGGGGFRLETTWSPHGTIIHVKGTRSLSQARVEVRPVPQSVVDYCAKLEAFGLKIKIENPEPPK